MQFCRENQESFSHLKHYRPFRYISSRHIRQITTAIGVAVSIVSVNARVAASQSNPTAAAAISADEAYRRGAQAFGQKDYASALMWYKQSADQGNVTAQKTLAAMFLTGRGAQKDYAQAMIWLRKAAEQNDPEAENQIGNMYATGMGVPDNAEAIKWYRKSAEQGYAPAQVMMGDAYAEAHGVPQDNERAVAWYQKAAAQGDTDAQTHLSRLKSRMNKDVASVPAALRMKCYFLTFDPKAVGATKTPITDSYLITLNSPSYRACIEDTLKKYGLQGR